jgi:hypothetical protein
MSKPVVGIRRGRGRGPLQARLSVVVGKAGATHFDFFLEFKRGEKDSAPIIPLQINSKNRSNFGSKQNRLYYRVSHI